MDVTWTVGVLRVGVECVQPLAGGTSTTRAEAVVSASDALAVAAMDRGRQEYRVCVADTLVGVVPGLTEQGDVDLFGLAEALPRITGGYR